MDDDIKKNVIEKDFFFMNLAYEEALKGAKNKEVPIGALLVDEYGEILSASHNKTIALSSRIAHAEMIILQKSQSLFLKKNITLYVTLEPCIMCLSASVLCGISSIIYAADSNEWGGVKNFLKCERKYFTRLPLIKKIDSFDKKISTLLKDFFYHFKDAV